MIVPTFHVRDMARSVRFYTEVLDFAAALVVAEPPGYAVLTRGGDELHLERRSAGQVGGGVAGVLIGDPDALFAAFRTRGLDPSHKPESPVHQGPLDQTWGTREFYADDPDGNTLRFVRR